VAVLAEARAIILKGEADRVTLRSVGAGWTRGRAGTGQGRAGIAHTHSTDVESTSRVRASVWASPRSSLNPKP
jgi:hypothetical protein